jgi:hypothetical protein
VALRWDAALALEQAGDPEPTIAALLSRATAAQARRSAPGTELQVCKVGDQDLALVMLESGNAVALPDALSTTEAEAQARQAPGLWHSDFVPPWQWRAGVPSGPAERSHPDLRCRAWSIPMASGSTTSRPIREYRATSIDPKLGDILPSDDEASGRMRAARARR